MLLAGVQPQQSSGAGAGPSSPRRHQPAEEGEEVQEDRRGSFSQRLTSLSRMLPRSEGEEQSREKRSLMLGGRSQPGGTPELGSCGPRRRGSPGSQYQTGWGGEGRAPFPSSQGGICTLVDLSLGGHDHAAGGEGTTGATPAPSLRPLAFLRRGGCLPLQQTSLHRVSMCSPPSSAIYIPSSSSSSPHCLRERVISSTGEPSLELRNKPWPRGMQRLPTTSHRARQRRGASPVLTSFRVSRIARPASLGRAAAGVTRGRWSRLIVQGKPAE